MPDRFIYFTAQDGITRWTPPKAPQNFHVYRIPAEHAATVGLWADAAWQRALQAGGTLLDYPKDQLDKLASWDTPA